MDRPKMDSRKREALLCKILTTCDLTAVEKLCLESVLQPESVTERARTCAEAHTEKAYSLQSPIAGGRTSDSERSQRACRDCVCYDMPQLCAVCFDKSAFKAKEEADNDES